MPLVAVSIAGSPVWSPANAPLLVCVIPIALIGRYWGRWPTFGATILSAAMLAARGWILGGQLSAVGYLTRATAFVTVAVLACACGTQGNGVRGSAGSLIPRPARGRSPRVTDVLTHRELEVLGIMAEGATNAEIADRLVISKSTVQSHVKSILRKLGAKNRTEAVSRYFCG